MWFRALPCDSLWAKKMKKSQLTAFRLPKEVVSFTVRMENDRVTLAGKAVLYSKAQIYVPEEMRNDQ